MNTPTNSQLIDIWMGGFTSGTLTALANLDIPTPLARNIIDTWAEAMRADPAHMDTIANEIQEILNNNPGPEGGRTLTCSVDRWATPNNTSPSDGA